MTPSITSLLVVLVLWFGLAVFCCGGGALTSERHKVTYRVDGSGSASLTYENESGGTEQHTVRLPWTLTFEGRSGEYLYLSAQGQEYASLTTSISVDGRVVKDASSSGDYSIATVSMLCCD